jgi:hypothetical protein
MKCGFVISIVDPGFWTTRQVILDEVQTEGDAWLESAKDTHPPSRPKSPWRPPSRETLFENGSATRQPDPEKIQAELYEQLGRLQMELAWVKKKSAS